MLSGCPGSCRIISSLSGLFRSTFSELCQPKMSPYIAKCPPGGGYGHPRREPALGLPGNKRIRQDRVVLHAFPCISVLTLATVPGGRDEYVPILQMKGLGPQKDPISGRCKLSRCGNCPLNPSGRDSGGRRPSLEGTCSLCSGDPALSGRGWECPQRGRPGLLHPGGLRWLHSPWFPFILRTKELLWIKTCQRFFQPLGYEQQRWGALLLPWEPVCPFSCWARGGPMAVINLRGSLKTVKELSSLKDSEPVEPITNSVGRKFPADGSQSTGNK